MKVIRNPKLFQQEMERLRKRGRSIGFVPTMGALHQGHLSLVERSKKENDVTAVSIFVNPLQFGPKEDLKKYPRPITRDKSLLKKEGADYLFLPAAESMYGKDYDTVIEIGTLAKKSSLTDTLCGKSRPGHFRGVATVVAKLFLLAKPNRAYFGSKDYQQSTVIKKLVMDLNFDIAIRVLPTVREKDGLAMSSRNQYLNESDRKRATALSQTLFWIKSQIKNGERNLSRVKKMAYEKLSARVDRIDYLELADGTDLHPVTQYQKNMVALTACIVGKTRLIDNVTIS